MRIAGALDRSRQLTEGRAPSLVYVMGFEQAEQRGASVLSTPKDQPWGVRSYAVLDPEGHQWEFATVTSESPAAPDGGG